MEKIIEIDLTKEEDLFEKYNQKQLSNELIEYILKEASLRLNKEDTITIIINNYTNNQNIKELLETKFKNEYNMTALKQMRNLFVQLVYLLVGMLALFISAMVKDTIFKEIVLIGGWVLIWYMVEIGIFSDNELRRKRKLLKRLLNGKINENKVK